MNTRQVIAVIGATGKMGSAISKNISKGNYRILLNSPDPDKVQSLIRDIKSQYPFADVETVNGLSDASWEADIIILAVSYAIEKEIAENIRKVVNQKIVISISNPLNDNNDGLLTAPGSSAGEELQKLLPNAKVIKAFNTILASDFQQPFIKGQQVDCFIAGNSKEALQAVYELVIIAGFNPVIAGDLSESRILESMHFKQHNYSLLKPKTMNKMLVAVFENESKAYEGLSALKDLHNNGDITLYASAVVSKDEKGGMRLNSAADQGPIGTTTGFLAGSILGLLGGPIGLALGAATGTFAGLIYDASEGGINATFAAEVANELTQGKTAVIAEIDETWTVPVDTRLKAMNAIVFRRLRDEVEEDQLARESQAIASEYQNLKDELKEAREEDKAAIKSAIAKLKGKAEVTNDLIKRKSDETRNLVDAKVNAMQQQLKDAGQRRKNKLEKRINEVKEEYRARTEKLKQASQLVDEAFGPKEELKKSVSGIA